jgi:hypothetical protein
VWVRISAVNNVDLMANYPGTNVFMIDRSPPLPGEVNDGRHEGYDMYFESTRDGKVCLNWDGFHDPESGISKYEWCIGTGTDNDKQRCNAVGNQVADFHVFSACAENVNLEHKQLYFATLWAVNHGHIPLRVQVSSDGVRIDKTEPVGGIVTDGANPPVDLAFTDEGHVVNTAWTAFKDPESKVVDYFISIGDKDDLVSIYPETSVACGDGTGFFSHEKPVKCEVQNFERHDFDIPHNTEYFTTVRGMNGAHDSTSVASSGVRVDLTPPELVHVGIGLVAGETSDYFKSDSEFSANWLFNDPESGIDRYEWRIYEVHGTATFLQVYPKDGDSWAEVGTATSATSDKKLFLKSGREYYADVVGINGAGRMGHFRTNAAMLDANPPTVHDITVGTQNADESAELIDGKYIIIADDADGIPAHWTATDDASGIVRWVVGCCFAGRGTHFAFWSADPAASPVWPLFAPSLALC